MLPLGPMFAKPRGDRPFVLTLVCTILVTEALFSLVAIPTNVRTPQFQSGLEELGLSFTLVVTAIYAVTGATLLSAMAMLWAKRWGRVLFSVTGISVVTALLIASENQLAPFPVFFAIGVLLVLAHRPAVARWFEENEARPARATPQPTSVTELESSGEAV